MLHYAENNEQKTEKCNIWKDGQITYQKLFWMFVIGSVIGIGAEGIWCVLNKGVWEYHPATIWGPFCIVYGVGADAVYIISILLKDKKIPVQFLGYTIAGGLVEYVASWVQELIFHSKSWDYSDHFLNIGGRVSLKMALIWGVLGVLFMYFVMPYLERMFGKMQGKSWSVACIVLTIFMVINLAVTSAALIRWRDRQANVPANSKVTQMIDQFYDDDFMERRYCNMNFE